MDTPLERARELRQTMTFSERLLWEALRAHRLGGWKWKRQVPVGPFIVDYMCDAARLIVELDGPFHADQVVYDARRTRYLERQGFRVVRFDSNLVIHDVDALCETILGCCGGPKRPHG